MKLFFLFGLAATGFFNPRCRQVWVIARIFMAAKAVALGCLVICR